MLSNYILKILGDRFIEILVTFILCVNLGIASFASPIIFHQGHHHTDISETYTYDESVAHEEVSLTGGLSRVLSEKKARPDYEVLSGVVSIAARGSKSFVQFSSKKGITKGGQSVFSYQARFPKPNLNVRLDRGFRAPFKNCLRPL